ncbi:MAG: hypothetical protein JXA21_12365 [Anaerolineae bacterium]|nr:hypothetical protein [Anaerolineae bacterium]
MTAKRDQIQWISVTGLLLLLVGALLTYPTLSTAAGPGTSSPQNPDADHIAANRNAMNGDAVLDHQLFYFEPNLGQADGKAQFVARGMGGALLFSPGEIEARLPVSTTEGNTAPPLASLAVQFDGANPDAQITGTQMLSGVVNYYVGSDERLWRTGVPAYSGIVYKDLYPGIDLYASGGGETSKWTLTVAPKMDPATIRWRYTGANEVVLDPASGDLHITFADGQGAIVDAAPVAWQEQDQMQAPVSVSYVISDDLSVGLAVGAYDHSLPLIIDPTLIYSTFWGGGQQEAGTRIALDGALNVCITGDTTSFAPGGFNDVYVTCFNAAGQWLYTTLVGGNSYEGGADLAFDGAGRLYVTGPTWSSNFPALNGSSYQGNGDAFILRLNGGALVNSGLIGGTGAEQGFSLAIDATGDVYVVGSTQSANVVQITPGTALYPAPQGGVDMFIVKLNNAIAATPLYGSYFGGSLDDCDFYIGCHVAVDSTNGVYLTGNTDSSNFPTLAALQGFNGGGTSGWAAEAFVTKLNWTGSQLALVYSTFLGGTKFEESYNIVVDSGNNAIVAGTTGSSDFPTTPFAIQPAFGGGDRDIFVSKLGWNGSSLSLVYSTYLGGSGTDQGNDVAVHPGTGTAYVTGYSNSPNYPTANALYPTLAGSFDVVVTGISSNGATLHYSTYMGSPASDGGNGIAVDQGCDVYITGGTSAGSFPTQNAWNPFYQGNGDAFVTRLGSSCPATITPNINNLTLNQGDTFTEVLTVTIPGNSSCVLDVYFLADTTGSMGGILSTIVANSSAIINGIATRLPRCDIAYGVGNYKDFPNDPYAFQHQLSLTSNTANVQTAIGAWTATGGWDAPEGELYALYKIGQNNSGAIGWRSNATQKIVVWFGDQPSHDPICQTIHNDGTIPFAVTQLNTAGILNGANIRVLAIDTGNLNGTAYAGDYAGCTGNGGMTPGAQAQFLAAATGGSYQAGVNATNIVNTIVSQVTALSAPPINNVSLVPSSSLLPFITSITPAGGYGPLDPTITHTLPFTVTFVGTVPCSDVPQVFTGLLNVVADGVIIATKTVVITVPPCVCVTPPPGMVAWWPLDETTPPWAYDITGGHTGIHVNGPVPGAGMVANALNFDGVNDYVRVANAPALNFGPAMPGTTRGDFSIDAWIYRDNLSAKEAPIVSKWDGVRGYYFFILEGRLALVLADGSGVSEYHVSSAPTIPAGVWVHVAVTVDRDNANGITFYVNGLPIGTQDPTGRPNSLVNAARLTIGASANAWLYTTWQYFDGPIDEVEIFNRVVSPSEILGIFQARSEGKCKPKPMPDLSIKKSAHEPFIIGGTGTYVLSVSNVGAVPAAGPIVVNDMLPAGFIPPITAGGSGWTCTVTGSAVSCTHPGPVPVGGSLPPIVIHATISDLVQPDIENCAKVPYTGDANPANNTQCIITHAQLPSPDLGRHDLGDAPASDNNSGAGMTAYPAIPANFPTVGSAAIPGPLHIAPQQDAWLGIGVTGEADADLMPDTDGVTNIDPTANIANRDKDDDGVQLGTVTLPRCRLTNFAYDASIIGGAGTRYLNVWFDFNHDGDFNDILFCKPPKGWFPVPVREWAVMNHSMSLGNGYYTGLLTPNFRSFRGTSLLTMLQPRWMRVTLSEQPSPTAGDGRGPVGGYQYGETEDYLLKFSLIPVLVLPDLATGAVVQNSLGFSDTLSVPTGAVTREVTLAYFTESTPITPTPGLNPVGLNFSLEAYVDDTLAPDFRFTRPYTITLNYGSGIPAGTFLASYLEPALYVWQGETWVPAACGVPVNDPDGEQIAIPVCATGEFALFTGSPQAQHTVYLPLITKN